MSEELDKEIDLAFQKLEQDNAALVQDNTFVGMDGECAPMLYNSEGAIKKVDARIDPVTCGICKFAKDYPKSDDLVTCDNSIVGDAIDIQTYDEVVYMTTFHKDFGCIHGERK